PKEIVDLAVSILQWLTHKPRPLRLSELQEGLELMLPPARNDDIFTEELVYGKSSRLWSPQDIVDVCGNLVIYSKSGTTFALIHLSAIQFLGGFESTNQPDPDHTIRNFIEGVQGAKVKLGTLCLNYLCRESLASHKFLTPLPSYTDRPLFDVDYPFFDFTVFYWTLFIIPELRVEVSDHIILSLLNSTLDSFISTCISIIWLEHAIRMSSVQIVIDTLEQLVTTSQGLMESVTAWAGDTIDTLITYTRVLSAHRAFLWKLLPVAHNVDPSNLLACQTLSKIDDMDTDGNGPRIHSFHPKSCAWIHYDHNTDILYSVMDGRMCLGGYFAKTGHKAMRLGIVAIHRRRCISSFTRYHAAAVTSPGAVSQEEPRLVTLMDYNVNTTQIDLSAPKTRGRFGTNSILVTTISFIGSQELATPHGILNLRMKQWLSVSSPTLYQPVMTERDLPLLSGDGTTALQVSQLNNIVFEIGLLDPQSGTNCSNFKSKWAGAGMFRDLVVDLPALNRNPLYAIVILFDTMLLRRLPHDKRTS
ncbi:hypothetical protein H0H92_005275, partial [Tricholoma furcatifolium]